MPTTLPRTDLDPQTETREGNIIFGTMLTAALVVIMLLYGVREQPSVQAGMHHDHPEAPVSSTVVR